MLRMPPVAILAGGRATRLHPLTRSIPKSLVNIAGRPFILHQLAMLRSQGVERVVLCLGHLGEQIQQLIGDGRELGLGVQYSYDGDQPLGTGGALRCALPLLGTKFFAMYGDSLPRVPLGQLRDAYRRAGCLAMLAVVHNANRWDASNVRLKEEACSYSKRSPPPGTEHIDAGLSLLASEVFAHYPTGGALDLADVFETLSARGQLAALELADRIYEIGSLQGIRDTESFLLQG
jgi:N-acetyl-alpha-D-muramate 1-phosphate uridylyltransferase